MVIFMPQRPLVGVGPLIIEASLSHSVGLLWTSDQPDAATTTLQVTPLTREKHPFPGGIRTRNPSKRAPADTRLRPRGYRYRRSMVSSACNCELDNDNVPRREGSWSR